jgi:hypothetical protein
MTEVKNWFFAAEDAAVKSIPAGTRTGGGTSFAVYFKLLGVPPVRRIRKETATLSQKRRKGP